MRPNKWKRNIMKFVLTREDIHVTAYSVNFLLHNFQASLLLVTMESGSGST
jgi:hypothetical protein